MSSFEQPVQDTMTPHVVTIHPDAGLREAERRLEEHEISCLGVIDNDGRLVGALSRTDLLRVGRLRARMADDGTLLTMPQQTVRHRMSSLVVSVDPDTPLRAAAARMLEHRVHRVFVVEQGRPVGVVSTRDLMQTVVEARAPAPISAWMTRPVMTVDVRESVGKATDRLAEAKVRGLVVVDDEWPVGVYTQAEVLGAASMDPETPVEEAMSCSLLCLPVSMPIFRAAALAATTRARRILAVDARDLRGIVTSLDMARVVSGQKPPHA